MTCITSINSYKCKTLKIWNQQRALPIYRLKLLNDYYLKVFSLCLSWNIFKCDRNFQKDHSVCSLSLFHVRRELPKTIFGHKTTKLWKSYLAITTGWIFCNNSQSNLYNNFPEDKNPNFLLASDCRQAKIQKNSTSSKYRRLRIFFSFCLPK